MRLYTTKGGEQRIWYNDGEIDEIMEAELARGGLLPDADAPAVEIESFVERHLQAHLDTYAALDPGVLGLTEFFVGARPRISINRDLTGSALDDDDPLPGLKGRWRATVAHEAAHVVLHRSLYLRDDQTLALFEAGAAQIQRLHRCPATEVSYRQRPNWDWREVQANNGMAALLMPRRLFGNVVRASLSVRPGEAISTGEAISLARDLAERFQVSVQAAQIRLQTLGFVGNPNQPSL